MYVRRVDGLHELNQTALEDTTKRWLLCGGCASFGDSIARLRSCCGGLTIPDGRRRLQDFSEECIGSAPKVFQMLVGYSVSVLLNETFALVCDIHSVVTDCEGALAEPWLLIELVLVTRVVVVQLVDVALVRAHWQSRLLVQ